MEARNAHQKPIVYKRQKLYKYL